MNAVRVVKNLLTPCCLTFLSHLTLILMHDIVCSEVCSCNLVILTKPPHLPLEKWIMEIEMKTMDQDCQMKRSVTLIKPKLMPSQTRQMDKNIKKSSASLIIMRLSSQYLFYGIKYSASNFHFTDTILFINPTITSPQIYLPLPLGM